MQLVTECFIVGPGSENWTEHFGPVKNLRPQYMHQLTWWYLMTVTGGVLCCLCRRFSSGTREKVLRWLFPKAELCPLLDSAGTIVQRCLVTHSTNSQSKVSSRPDVPTLTDCRTKQEYIIVSNRSDG